MKELLTRILVAIVGIPIVLASVIFGRFYFVALVTLAALVGLYELFQMMKRQGIKPHQFLGYLGLASITILTFYHKSDLILITLLFVSLLSLGLEMFRLEEKPMLNVAVTLFGLNYIGLAFASLIGVRESQIFSGYNAVGHLVIALFIGVWICDTVAYFFGTRFGKHRLYEQVSPKKSVEGAVAGFVGVVLFYFIILQSKYLPEMSVQMAVILALVVGIFGQIGDLVESWLKRTVQIKDSSAIIPGHGGVLDRFDSMLFVAPLTYIAIQLHLM